MREYRIFSHEDTKGECKRQHPGTAPENEKGAPPGAPIPLPYTDFSAPPPTCRANGADTRAEGREHQKASCLRMESGSNLKSANPVMSELTTVASSS